MTDSPQPPEYEPVRPDRSESLIPSLVAWLIIAGCVGLVMYRVSRAYKNAAEKGLTNPSSELQVQFTGKTAVGSRGITSGWHPTTRAPRDPNKDQLCQAMGIFA